MRQIWILARRELNSYFDSLMAYILIILFLGFTGFFTWLNGQGDVFYTNQASLQTFFQIAYWSLFFFIPALTMRLIAEEKKTGTIDLLFTKAISDWQIVFGKFLATLSLITISLLLTLPYYYSISHLGNVDHGAILTGYLGLVLMSAAYISIGIFASSITNNQIVAFLLALLIGICFHLIFMVLSGAETGVLGNIFHFLNLNSHYESVSRGVLDSKDILYFVSMVVIWLSAAEFSLNKRSLI